MRNLWAWSRDTMRNKGGGQKCSSCVRSHPLFSYSQVAECCKGNLPSSLEQGMEWPVQGSCMCVCYLGASAKLQNRVIHFGSVRFPSVSLHYPWFMTVVYEFDYTLTQCPCTFLCSMYKNETRFYIFWNLKWPEGVHGRVMQKWTTFPKK